MLALSRSAQEFSLGSCCLRHTTFAMCSPMTWKTIGSSCMRLTLGIPGKSRAGFSFTLDHGSSTDILTIWHSDGAQMDPGARRNCWQRAGGRGGQEGRPGRLQCAAAVAPVLQKGSSSQQVSWTPKPHEEVQGQGVKIKADRDSVSWKRALYCSKLTT